MLPILNQSLWRDEAFSALLSEKNPLQIISLSMQDTTPPLHYLLLHYWMVAFGTSEVALRGLSFIFHILTVFVIFLIAKKLIKSTLAQSFIVLATLINPFLLQYAFEARAYSLLALLSVLGIYFIINKKYVLSSVVFALAVFTHNFTLFTLIALVFWFFYTNRQRLKETKTEILQLFTAPVLALLVWGSVIWQQWTEVASGFWIKPAIFSLFLNSFEKYSKGDLSYPSQPMLYTFTLILCFFAFGYWLWREQKEEQGKALLLLSFVALVPTLITYIISAIFVPIYDERYMIATVPVLILLVGYSLFRLFEVNHRVKNFVVAFVAIYLLLLIQASEQIVSMSTKPPINYAVSQVLAQAKPGEVIIPQSNLNFLETKWYVRQNNSPMLAYAYAPSGNVPFYIGSLLFEPQEIITQMPKGVQIWQIKSDGGYELLKK
ncbi:MAG: glycosyltransferase family 39 protein [Candidatus Levybacteria bacterium]|nr:glycosyltransferase family 39 protein [Candidatus Levybacteria bacterium]